MKVAISRLRILVCSSALLFSFQLHAQSAESIQAPTGVGQFDPANAVSAPPASAEGDSLLPEIAPGGAPCQPATGCCELCGGGTYCPSCWYFDNGVRILARDAPRHQALILEGLNPTKLITRDIFNSSELSYGIAPGYTATLGRYLGRTMNNYDSFGEVSYWGLNQWNNTFGVDTNGSFSYSFGGAQYQTGDLFTPFGYQVGGFSRVDQATFDVQHRVNNVELNLWFRPRPNSDRLVLLENGRWVHECQPGCYWSHMIGFRTMIIDDDFAMHTLGHVTQGGTDTPVSGDYSIQARNRLLGFQVGGDLMWRNCRWSWGTRYRVAPFVNLADQESTITSDGAADPLATGGNFNLRRTADADVAAVALELGFVGSYKILPHLVLHAAYDLMWVPGVALGPDQLDFTLNPDASLNAPAHLNTGGTLFYQGLTMSAELTW